MIAKRSLLEEQVYLPIISQFDEREVDYEMLGKIIVDVCNRIEKSYEKEVDPKIVVKNALLLMLGLLHKDEPVDPFGKDVKSLDPEDVERISRDLEDLF